MAFVVAVRGDWRWADRRMNARRSRPSSDRSTRSPNARPRKALGRRLL